MVIFCKHSVIILNSSNTKHVLSGMSSLTFEAMSIIPYTCIGIYDKIVLLCFTVCTEFIPLVYGVVSL